MGAPEVYNLYTAPGVVEALKSLPGVPHEWPFTQRANSLHVFVPNGDLCSYFHCIFLWSKRINKWMLYAVKFEDGQ